jgi:hypothetical protein
VFAYTDEPNFPHHLQVCILFITLFYFNFYCSVPPSSVGLILNLFHFFLLLMSIQDPARLQRGERFSQGLGRRPRDELINELINLLIILFTGRNSPSTRRTLSAVTGAAAKR